MITDWLFFLSSPGIAAVLVGHPLDLVKVRRIVLVLYYLFVRIPTVHDVGSRYLFSSSNFCIYSF
jgi:hypothetical protein